MFCYPFNMFTNHIIVIDCTLTCTLIHCSAGLQRYDTITKVDGKEVDGFTDLANAVREKSVVKCTIYREGSTKELYIKF